MKVHIDKIPTIIMNANSNIYYPTSYKNRIKITNPIIKINPQLPLIFVIIYKPITAPNIS